MMPSRSDETLPIDDAPPVPNQAASNQAASNQSASNQTASNQTADRGPEASGFDVAGAIRRGVFIALGALSLYLLHPKVIEVLSSAERLRTIHLRWFIVMLVMETISFVCTWWLLRIVLPQVSWFVAATSQLCANAVSRVLPGSAAVGGATLYRMLSVSGVGAAEAGGALAATSILSTAALFAIPATAFLMALLGAPVPESLWPAAVAGGVMFVALVGAGAVAAAFDRPLVLLGRALNRVVVPVSRRLHRPKVLDPQHLLDERDRLRVAVDAAWGRAIVAAAGNWAFDYLALVSALYAVGANPRLSLVLLAYAGAQVLAMIPLTPGGFGFVEAGLLYLLVVSGISTQDAALATAAYRAVSFLFPILLGAPAYLAHRYRFRFELRTTVEPQ